MLSKGLSRGDMGDIGTRYGWLCNGFFFGKCTDWKGER